MNITRPSASFTRPADTTAYASGDLVANSTTAGSVVPMTLTISPFNGGFRVRRFKLHKSGTSTTNAQFRVHLFVSSTITVTNGDNAAFSVSSVDNYIGSADVTIGQAFTDGSAGFALPATGTDMAAIPTGAAAVYALLEARAAYTPASGEVFTLSLDCEG